MKVFAAVCKNRRSARNNRLGLSAYRTRPKYASTLTHQHVKVATVRRGKGAPVGKPAKETFDPKNFLAKVGAGKSILEFQKNQNVFAQGDVADTVFYIQKGRVKLTVLSEQGKEAVVGILEPGQFFGEGCLKGHPLRIATTTAMEECVITSIT